MRKVLIIDDDEALREAMELLLSGEGYEVRVLDEHAPVLKEVAAFVPDVILLDMMMPGASGQQVARSLRNDPFASQIPIVALSAMRHPQSTLDAVGAQAFLSKPFELKELLSTINSAIARRQIKPA